MIQNKPEYIAVEGKTYSLFGDSASTGGYYDTISSIADKVLEMYPDIKRVIDIIAGSSSGKRALIRILNNQSRGNEISVILELADPILRKFTEKVNKHLETIPLNKRWDRTLATSREQYHFYMLEIELTNRLYSERFKTADRKIALMPYCLQDFAVSCLSAKNGFDFQCRHCSGKCFQNQASTILSRHNVEPYIWQEGNMKKLACQHRCTLVLSCR